MILRIPVHNFSSFGMLDQDLRLCAYTRLLRASGRSWRSCLARLWWWCRHSRRLKGPSVPSDDGDAWKLIAHKQFDILLEVISSERKREAKKEMDKHDDMSSIIVANGLSIFWQPPLTPVIVQAHVRSQHGRCPESCVLAFSPIMLTGSKGQTIWMWQYKTRKAHCTITAHRNTLFEIDHHPTKRWLVSCGATNIGKRATDNMC
jgi:hypothetical protein